MSSENQANEEENDVIKKQEHIKDRLKEMGVSSDSVRPEKSWLSKYINYIIVLVIATLVTGYWYENKKQNSADEIIAANEVDIAPTENTHNPIYANQQYDRIPAAGHESYELKRQEYESQNSFNNRDAVNQMQNGAMNYPQYNNYYQPQYPSYSQQYGPGYNGYYQPRPQMPTNNRYRNTQQGNYGAYQQSPAYNYPRPSPGQMYYYNGWQR